MLPLVGRTSLLFALLQSLCTAVLTISGIRVAIGLTALAAAGGIWAPATRFHQDAIRIPMLAIAAGGAIVNLAVLAWIRHLRARPSAQWRRREIGPKQRRSERLQVVLAILTLVLVGLETWTHTIIHRTGPPPGAHSARSSTACVRPTHPCGKNKDAARMGNPHDTDTNDPSRREALNKSEIIPQGLKPSFILLLLRHG